MPAPGVRLARMDAQGATRQHGNTRKCREGDANETEKEKAKGVKRHCYLDKLSKLSSTRVACRHTSRNKPSHRAG